MGLLLPSSQHLPGVLAPPTESHHKVRMDSLTGQQLLGKDEKVVSADSVLEDKRIIAFYFSAHWCPPCRLFTPLLTEFYSDLVTSGGEPLEIVFVSSDKTPEDMMTYMKE